MTSGPDDQDAAAGGRGRIRASHADRERVVGMLTAAFAQGRLSRDEFDLRLSQALAARTDTDLAALTADLPAEPARVAPPRHRGRRSRRMKVSVLAAIGSVCLVLLAAVAGSSIRSGAPTACSFAVPQTGTGPLPGGKKTTVAAAQSLYGFPVPVPDTSAASQANLTQVWENGQQVALVYANGAITITMAPAAYADAREFYRKLMAGIHAGAAIGQVHGQPALVITPHTDACDRNPAWVEFDWAGIDINVSSYRYGTHTLVAVADSMRQRVPWHPGHRAHLPQVAG